SNPSGSRVMAFGVGCGSCIEEMYGLNWLPPLAPIFGHWWLLKHTPFQDDWIVAERDAPWRPYTSMHMDLRDPYQGARVDWWMLDWVRTPQQRLGIIVLVVMSLALLRSL